MTLMPLPPLPRPAVSLAIVLLAAGLAACGGSSPSATTTTAGGGGSASSSTTSTAGVTTTVTATKTVPASTPPPAAASRAPLCTAARLSLSFLGGQAATGHGLLAFAVRNRGPGACHTYGYPGVLFLDHGGRGLPTVPIHTTQDFFGSAPLVELILAPGASASFRIGVTHGNGSAAGCTTAYGLQVIPPDDTATLRTTLGPGGAYECRTATVTPLRPGQSANPGR